MLIIVGNAEVRKMLGKVAESHQSSARGVGTLLILRLIRRIDQDSVMLQKLPKCILKILLHKD
jgi:hypothetical protein